jgi:hypothetical protein
MRPYAHQVDLHAPNLAGALHAEAVRCRLPHGCWSNTETPRCGGGGTEGHQAVETICDKRPCLPLAKEFPST